MISELFFYVTTAVWLVKTCIKSSNLPQSLLEISGLLTNILFLNYLVFKMYFECLIFVTLFRKKPFILKSNGGVKF